MNTDTGHIYRTDEDIEAARQREENLVDITPSFGYRNREGEEARRYRAHQQRVQQTRAFLRRNQRHSLRTKR